MLELDLVYKTQKVLGLLKRVGCMSYEWVGLVLDFFCLGVNFN